MPLELATRLILRTAKDGSPLTSKRLRELCAEWADVPEAATAVLKDEPGRRGGRVSTREARLDDEQWRWDLLLSRADDSDPSVEWVAAVTALFDPDRTTFVVRLRRDSRDHRLRPLAGAPAPPAVIRLVLRAPDVECFDGPLPVGSRYRELGSDDIQGFVSTCLLAEDRRLPVLAVAKQARTASGRLEVTELTRVLAGFAHVVLVDRQALLALASELGDLSLAQDSARLWWPGMELDDAPDTHPSYDGARDDPAEVVETIRRLVLTVSRDRWREPARLVDFGRSLRRRQEDLGRAAAERMGQEIARLRESAAAESTRVHDAGGQAAAAARDHEEELERMASDLEEVTTELEREQADRQDAEALWEEAQGKADRLEQQTRALSGQLAGAQATIRQLRAVEGQQPPSEEQLFEDDVQASWRERLTKDDRKSHPLEPFRINEDFLTSISRTGADRAKVVATAMEVACGRAREIDGRQLHKLRAGMGGNAPERRREADGAVAWRCNVQTNSPSARRLHYWAVPDGSIEFACVVVHDDFAIPD